MAAEQRQGEQHARAENALPRPPAPPQPRASPRPGLRQDENGWLGCPAPSPPPRPRTPRPRLPFYERNEVQDARTGSKGDHSPLAVLEPIVDQDKGLVPIQLGGEGQGDTVLGEVGLVFEWVELNQHALM